MSAARDPELGRLDEYRLNDPVEIHSVLRDLVKYGALLSVFVPGQSNASCVGRVRELDESGITLAVDREALIEHEIFSNPAATAVAFSNQFKVQFPFDAMSAPIDTNDPVVKLAYPNVLYRIQRRGGFRIKPLPSMQAVCDVRLTANRTEAWPVFDLSVVGVGLWLPPEREVPQPGALWRSCLIRIDRLAPILVDMRVSVTTGKGGTVEKPARTLVGCAFVRPTPETQRLLQRSVIELQYLARQLLAA